MSDREVMETFDFVIVGAGAAGCVLASRLTEDRNATVCLLEAGPDDSNPLFHIPGGFVKVVTNPKYNWGFETSPGPSIADRSISLTQAKVVGGGTSINGMVAVRGQAVDYDGWASMGASGWAYQDVLPYFKRLEATDFGEVGFRGVEGPYRISRGTFRNAACDAFIEAAADSGLPTDVDYNGKGQISVGYTQQSIHGRRRVSAASAYLTPARRRSNLAVRTEAMVERIGFSGKRATTVYYRRPDGSTNVIQARREVILAAGAINTPRLLQVSGIGPGHVLQDIGITPISVSPAVGINLQDHYLVSMSARGRNYPSFNQMSKGPRLWAQVARWLLGRPSLITTTPAAISFFLSSEGGEVADIQGLFNPANFLPGGKRQFDALPGMSCAVWQHRPDSRGYVKVTSADINVKPVVQPNYLSNFKDCEVLLAAMKYVRRLFRSPKLSGLIARELTPGAGVNSDEELLDYARHYGGTVYHPVGTSRMGASDDDYCVVDPALLVRGVDGLRIVDASVMPTLTSGNTGIPTLMIAEKAADLIRASIR